MHLFRILAIVAFSMLTLFSAAQAQQQPAPAVQSTAPSAGHLPVDLSPWGMFMNADIVVKAVMIGLAFASLVTWTIWLAKSLELFGARMRAQNALGAIVAARTLDEASGKLG